MSIISHTVVLYGQLVKYVFFKLLPIEHQKGKLLFRRDALI